MDYFGCRVDDINKINIFGIRSFDAYNDIEYEEVIKKCVRLIDNNTYPVILVNILNSGGLIETAQYLLEELSPKKEINIIGALRKTSIFDKNSTLIYY